MVPYLFCIRLALSCSHEKKPRLGNPGELGTVTFFDSTVQTNDTKMRGADLFVAFPDVHSLKSGPFIVTGGLLYIKKKILVSRKIMETSRKRPY